MDRPELIKWGSLAGIAGAVTFSLLWAAAIIADGHWLFGIETLSELGGHRPGRYYFNIGVMVMGILSIPFGMALHQQLTQKRLGRISTMIFIVAAVLLIGVGVFPIDTGAPHTFFSWGFFITIITTMTLMLHPYRCDMKLCRLGFATTAVVVLIGYGTILLVSLDLMELALSEALIVMGLNIWVVITGVLLLRTR
jgi:hypothetical membrane protein